MANDFEKAYEQHKLEEKMKKNEPINNNPKKKSLPIYVYILIAMISSAAIRALMHTRRFTDTDIAIFWIVGIIAVASLIYFIVKKYKVVDKIKDYKKTPNPDELLKWFDLKEKGVITEEEFEQHKKRILK